MKINKKILIACTLLIAVLFTDCKKKTKPQSPEEENFDRPAMLSNYADNLVVPNLRAFKKEIDSLLSAFNAFSANKSTAAFEKLRENYSSAYLQFQHVSLFEFGPAESEIIRSNFNTFPVEISQVNNNITSGTYNLATISNLDAKGFPAIDYLLFDKDKTEAELIALFDTDPKAAKRLAYMAACVAEMQMKTNTVLDAWEKGYRDTFVASTGSQIGSSLGMLVNQLNFEIDLLKNQKIGIPLGKKSLGGVLPEKCEAYYANQISVKLAKACLQNIEDVYLGRSSAGVDGKGIDDLLETLQAMHGSETLNSAIKNQFKTTREKLALVNEPLSLAVSNANAVVDAAYFEIVKLLVLLKTDTPSALGIVITYQDGDGD